jgi:hypothetical protein
MKRLKIEVKVQQGLPLDMVHHCQQNLCPQDEDITKKYTTTSYLIYIIGIQCMSKFMYMLCIKYVEMQAHDVYKMCNKNIIFLQCWLMVY